MFEKNLNELIKGIRAHKGSEAKYIDSAINDCRKEIKSKDIGIKAKAILKLAYLQMYGYDFSWASFQVIEVMSAPTLKEKTIGYLAASLSFKPDTDVLMLTTNLIKKDLASAKSTEVGIAIDGLASIATPGLAMDLFSDLLPMLNHSKPLVRKKAVLAMYKIFLQYPDALRVVFPRLREKLDDADISVVSATVNVICELARKNPKNYLPLAPQLFNLLTTSNNNWMVIKVIKLFTTMTPLEPRLVKKLVPPLTEIINNTPAMSLLYEAIRAVIAGGMLTSGPHADILANTCVNKLRTFLEESDQNLKYVGLLALAKITSTHADLVSDHQDLILSCIDDADISIRLRALDLIVGMVTRENLTDIVKQLMMQLLDPPPDSTSAPLPTHYRIEVVRRILAMSTRDNYSNIGNNFEWYVAVLVDLARIAKVDVGVELGQEILNVAVRVKSVRGFCVRTVRDLLRDFEVMVGVLGAAAWILGEYCSLLDDPKTGLEALLTPYATKFPARIQSVYIQAIPKVFAVWANETTSTWTQEKKIEVEFILEQILPWIENFRYSADLEVQERAVGFSQIFFKLHDEIKNTPVPEPRQYQDEATESWDTSKPQVQFPIITQLSELFGGTELNPVSAKAQRRVPIPEGLDLDTPLYTTKQIIQWPSASLEEEEPPRLRIPSSIHTSSETRRQEYLDRIRDDPFYIASDTRPRTSGAEEEEDFDAIPIIQFDGGTNLLTPMTFTKVKKKKKKAREIVLEEPVDIAVDEMPENAAVSDTEANGQERRGVKGNNVLRGKSGKGLEDVDFEEEERLEREAIEAERVGRLTRNARTDEVVEVEEPLVVEKVKKKKREGERIKKVKKKKKSTEDSVGIASM